MSLLHRARFFTTVASLDQLDQPQFADPLPEVAFVGRSNAGKSTAINLLCNQKRLAFASKTPGRTQHLNFFEVADRDRRYGYLVDLPGYGFAHADRDMTRTWDAFLGGYLGGRANLRGIILLMDARRPLTELDEQLLDFLAPTGKPVHTLLTKADKLNRAESQRTLAETSKILQSQPATGGRSVQLFSALKRVGIEQADETVRGWLESPPLAP